MSIEARRGFKNSRNKLDLMVAAWDAAVTNYVRNRHPDHEFVELGTTDRDRDIEKRIAHYRIAKHYHLFFSVSIRELDARLIANIDDVWVGQEYERQFQQACVRFSKVDPSLHPKTIPDPEDLTKATPAPDGKVPEAVEERKTCAQCGQIMSVTESIQGQDENGKTVHYKIYCFECTNPLHRPIVHAERMK